MDGGKSQWLFFKGKDEYATPGFDVVTERPGSVLSGIRATRGPIPAAKRAYFQQRLRNRIFNFLLEKFLSGQETGLTKAILSRRITIRRNRAIHACIAGQAVASRQRMTSDVTPYGSAG